MEADRLVLITGGGRGIGAETAKLFARNGYAVCINYLSNASAANRVVDEIGELGGHCTAVQSDISREAGVAELFNAVDRAPGRLTVLVNNAAVLKTQCQVVDLDEDRINEIFRVNVTSCFLCCREAVKRMSSRTGGQGGAIVNVSSVAARSGSPNEYVDYAASKGAIDTLTRGLALEVAEQGIRVNGVRPGPIYTAMHAAGGEANRVDRVKAAVPMRRGGEASEIAEAILWLASDRASFATGSILDVAGGL